MKAWFLNGLYDLHKQFQPLEQRDVPIPVPGESQILVRIACCGVCHTELDEIEGRAQPSAYPVIPGHQVVGYVESCGINANRFVKGDRVGVAWIFSACGICEFCKIGLENLCPEFKATGRDAHGGYAEYMVAEERFAYRIPGAFSNEEAAPLLCAGAIGYRSLHLTGLQNRQTLGLTGFGASGHLVLKLAKYLYPESHILVFARSIQEQSFARSLGAFWSGNVTDVPPEKSNAIIDTTPVWKTVVASLQHLKPGGRLVINAIRKEAGDHEVLMDLDYQKHLWLEKEIKSVANITRRDVEEFLQLASAVPIKPETQKYSFDQANQALLDLKHKHVRGAKVLMTNL